MTIYDNQKKEYVNCSIEQLYEIMLGGSCECGEGSDVLDKKDEQMKCENCRKLNNIESITINEMKCELEEVYDFKIN